MGQTAGKPNKLVDPPKPLAKKKSSNRGPPPPYTSANAEIITAEVETDTKTQTWNFKNFTKLRRLTPNYEEMAWFILFPADEETPTTTSWRLEMRINKKEELQVRLKLENSEPEQDEDPTDPVVDDIDEHNKKKGDQKVIAYFTPSVKDPKDPTKILFYKSVGLREYIVDEYRHLDDCTKSKRWVKLATMKKLESSGALTGDVLSIGIHLEIYQKMKFVTVTSTNNEMGGESSSSRPSTSTDQDPIASTSTTFKEMVKHFEELLETGKGADFILRVKESQFCSNSNFAEIKVHKAILSRNPVFAKMMESEMVDKNGEIESLTIDDVSPLCLNILLHFIYTGNVHEDWELIPGEVKMAAEKYGVTMFKQILLEK